MSRLIGILRQNHMKEALFAVACCKNDLTAVVVSEPKFSKTDAASLLNESSIYICNNVVPIVVTHNYVSLRLQFYATLLESKRLLLDPPKKLGSPKTPPPVSRRSWTV